MIRIQDPQQIKIAKKSEKDIIIFVDMDGVMTNWEKLAARTCDLDYSDTEIRKSLISGKKLEELLDGGEDELWEKINAEGEEWWEKMEKFPWADDLFNFCKEQTENVFYLSSPSDNPICASGKIKWIINNHGEDFKHFLLGWPKWACAGPNKILIDDDEKKGRRFEENGGVWFQWPHPLKIIDGEITIEEVIKDLEKTIKEVKTQNR